MCCWYQLPSGLYRHAGLDNPHCLPTFPVARIVQICRFITRFSWPFWSGFYLWNIHLPSWRACLSSVMACRPSISSFSTAVLPLVRGSCGSLWPVKETQIITLLSTLVNGGFVIPYNDTLQDLVITNSDESMLPLRHQSIKWIVG